jgi:hypothetical protein
MKKYIIALLVLLLPVLAYGAQRTVPWNINTTTNVVWPYGKPDSTVKVGIGTTAPSSDLEIARETPMFKLLDNSSASFATFSVSNTTLSILFGLNGAEIPASITSDGSTIVFSPTGVGGLTFAVDSLSFLTGFAGVNATDYTFKGDPATGGSNLDGGDLTMSPGSVTGSGKSDFVIKAAGGNAAGSTVYNSATVATFTHNRMNFGTTTTATTTAYATLMAQGTTTSPQMSLLNLASSTGATMFNINNAGHIQTGGGTPTVSTCGTSPSISGNDTAGTITVGAGVVTACTITFAKVRTNIPRVVGVVTGGGLSIAGGYSAKSTSAVTFSFAATVGAGTFDYYIVE